MVGCAHGELDAIYAAIDEVQRVNNIQVELIICPGDFQAVRHAADLEFMSCPPKFKDMRSFWKYYAGKSTATIPTLFVGGNHEASNHLQQIPLGGLVAPNMYFLGNAGVVSFRGLRIGGISGVYTQHNYEKERFEQPPYPRNQKKSVYHTRKQDVDRLMRIGRPLDVFISHDWPRGITQHGDLNELLRAKPFLRSEITNGSFGNPGSTELLHHLQPRFWFAAHMHVKFAALVKHSDSRKETKFLALDKVLPRRDFVQILDIPLPGSARTSQIDSTTKSSYGDFEEPRFELDPEWLSILHTEATQGTRLDPPRDEEVEHTMNRMKQKNVKPYVLAVSDFVRTAPVHNAKNPPPAIPDGIDLQENTLQLIDALELSADLWSNSVSFTASTAVE